MPRQQELLSHFYDLWVDLVSTIQMEQSDEIDKKLSQIVQFVTCASDDDLIDRCLNLMWDFAISNDLVQLKSVQKALMVAHSQIVTRFPIASCSLSRRLFWIEKSIRYLKRCNKKKPLPVTTPYKLIRELLETYEKLFHDFKYDEKKQLGDLIFLPDIVHRLNQKHNLYILLFDDLKRYCKGSQRIKKGYAANLQDRLTFILFILDQGYIYTSVGDIKRIWSSLVANGSGSEETTIFFQWLHKILRRHPYNFSRLDRAEYEELFKDCFLQLNPCAYTVDALHCFLICLVEMNVKRQLPDNKKAEIVVKFMVSDVKKLLGFDRLWFLLMEISDDLFVIALEFLHNVLRYMVPYCKDHHHFYEWCLLKLRVLYFGSLNDPMDPGFSFLKISLMNRILRVIDLPGIRRLPKQEEERKLYVSLVENDFSQPAQCMVNTWLVLNRKQLSMDTFGWRQERNRDDCAKIWICSVCRELVDGSLLITLDPCNHVLCKNPDCFLTIGSTCPECKVEWKAALHYEYEDRFCYLRLFSVAK